MYNQENYDTAKNLGGILAGTEEFFEVSRPGRKSFLRHFGRDGRVFMRYLGRDGTVHKMTFLTY